MRSGFASSSRPTRIGTVPTQVVDQFAEPIDQRNVDLLVVSGSFQVVDGVRRSPAETSVGLGVQPHMRDQSFAGVAPTLQHPSCLFRVIPSTAPRIHG